MFYPPKEGANVADREGFFLPSGSSDNPTPARAQGATFFSYNKLVNARLRRGWSWVITGPRREKKAAGEFIRFEK